MWAKRNDKRYSDLSKETLYYSGKNFEQRVVYLFIYLFLLPGCRPAHWDWGQMASSPTSMAFSKISLNSHVSDSWPPSF